MLVTEIYGGKVDDDDDFKELRDLVENIFTPAAFEDEYNIIQNISKTYSNNKDGDHHGLALPAGVGWKDFMEWVNRLPEREPPTYLGLPADAEKLLLVGQANEMIEKLRGITESLEEREQIAAVEEERS